MYTAYSNNIQTVKQ